MNTKGVLLELGHARGFRTRLWRLPSLKGSAESLQKRLCGYCLAFDRNRGWAPEMKPAVLPRPASQVPHHDGAPSPHGFSEAPVSRSSPGANLMPIPHSGLGHPRALDRSRVANWNPLSFTCSPHHGGSSLSETPSSSGLLLGSPSPSLAPSGPPCWLCHISPSVPWALALLSSLLSHFLGDSGGLLPLDTIW